MCVNVERLLSEKCSVQLPSLIPRPTINMSHLHFDIWLFLKPSWHLYQLNCWLLQDVKRIIVLLKPACSTMEPFRADKRFSSRPRKGRCRWQKPTPCELKFISSLIRFSRINDSCFEFCESKFWFHFKNCNNNNKKTIWEIFPFVKELSCESNSSTDGDFKIWDNSGFSAFSDFSFL